MKCIDCSRLYAGIDENKNTVYICFSKGIIIKDTEEEFEKCEFRR